MPITQVKFKYQKFQYPTIFSCYNFFLFYDNKNKSCYNLSYERTRPRTTVFRSPARRGPFFYDNFLISTSEIFEADLHYKLTLENIEFPFCISALSITINVNK